MIRLLTRLLVLGLLAAGAVLWFTRAQPVAPERFASLAGDAARGESVFWAAGCSSCHKAEGSDDPLVLAGGQRFVTQFGTFIAPNVSPDPIHGIGEWSQTDFASAVLNGTSPDGKHYFPAFPYTTYGRMTDADVADLWAFWQTLPSSDVETLPHEVVFPFNIRASLGPWKKLFRNREWVAAASSPELERGRYLVEALGHCAECHTPRNLAGGLQTSNWMGGAPNPSGKGRIPGISPDHLDWSATDIAYYLETGFTPEFDSAGGKMADVVTNLAKLSAEDRVAITAYLKSLP